MTVDGSLAVLAKILEGAWKLRVIVPTNIRNRKIRKRTLNGTPVELATALGLKLGGKLPKRQAHQRRVVVE
ncbi:MAG: hypothetical protein KIT22_04140 [Verrucomicrobiae bacterium]|nr:hypothetical protein [Verrucomicrobiae bacterium]